jgi:hypothetical protein
VAMKVSLRTVEETSGLIRKTTEYVLYVKVELAPEEKAAIKKAGIEDLLLMEYSYKGLELNWKVKSVVYESDKGKESRFVGSNAMERNEIEGNVKSALKALKSQIEAQMSSSNRAESFEI